MGTIVETRGLSKQFQKKNYALDNLSITITSGKIIGLLAPNGSGKTTLIKLINGLITPTKGEVLINGQKPGTESKKHISYLPERNYLNKRMTVEQMLAFFADFYEDFSMERANEMLANLNIDKKSVIKTLSKGTIEKVQLILVMSREAELYILDEPIAGVDPAARDYIIRTILTNYNPEASILISTHLITDIENVLDEVIMLRQGKLLLQMSAEELRDREGKSIDTYFREVFSC